MIEINEIMPLYICNRQQECKVSTSCGGDECNHITSPFEAANSESVEVFNKFADKFYVYVDDLGRLVCVERLNKGEAEPEFLTKCMNVFVKNDDCVYCVKEIDNAGLEGFRCSNSDAIKKNRTTWCRPLNGTRTCFSCDFYEKR